MIEAMVKSLQTKNLAKAMEVNKMLINAERFAQLTPKAQLYCKEIVAASDGAIPTGISQLAYSDIRQCEIPLCGVLPEARSPEAQTRGRRGLTVPGCGWKLPVVAENGAMSSLGSRSLGRSVL